MAHTPGAKNGQLDPGSSKEPSIIHGSVTSISKRLIYDYLDQNAAENPHAIAVQDIHGDIITYEQLWDRSTRLSQALRTLGVSRHTRVCLVLERSIAQVVTMFAVLRAGAAYIPLDGSLVPQTTLADVIENAQPTVVLVSKIHCSRMVAHQERWFCIEDLLRVQDSDAYVYSTHLSITPSDSGSTNDPAYIIYTSGARFSSEVYQLHTDHWH